MNKLKEEILDKFGVNHFYKDFGATIKERVIYCKPEELIDWINQNYISKQQILNLECLKEEPLCGEEYCIDCAVSVKINKRLSKIKEEINNLK